MTKTVDLMYVENGGDIVHAYEQWSASQHMVQETSKTYSGDVFTFCKNNHFQSLVISANANEKIVEKEDSLLMHMAKKTYNSGLGYHLSQIHYGLKLLKLAIKYKPKYLHIVDGTTYFFLLSPLKLMGIKTYIHYHNTLWPTGFYPQGSLKKALLKLEAFYLKHCTTQAYGVSTEVVRQIKTLTHNDDFPAFVYVPQFPEKDFKEATHPTPHTTKPFNVVYAGRVEENKGLFDIIEMAKTLKDKNVVFHICGNGSAYEDVVKACHDSGLEEKVIIHGALKRPELLNVYNEGHVVIIPTRSTFAEGFAKVAAEAILLDTPIITSPVVPALETLKSCAMEAKTNDVASYVTAIEKLMDDKSLYQTKAKACSNLKKQFFDGKHSLLALLEHSIVPAVSSVLGYSLLEFCFTTTKLINNFAGF
jgi:glycogen synthase